MQKLGVAQLQPQCSGGGAEDASEEVKNAQFFLQTIHISKTSVGAVEELDQVHLACRTQFGDL